MRGIAIFFLTFVLFSCAEYKVKSSKEPNIDFDQYATWCWMNNCNPSFEGPAYIYPKEVMENIVNAIAEEMYNKGYEQQDENSDLLVDFHLVLKADSSVNTVVHEQTYPLWDNYYDSELYYRYLVGTLIIDIADREKGNIVWRSVTERYLPLNPKISHEEVRKGIKKALKDFPKKQKK